MIVLPEIFGLNDWVRGVADRLSATGVPALAMPLFARTAPDLELGYDPADMYKSIMDQLIYFLVYSLFLLLLNLLKLL